MLRMLRIVLFLCAVAAPYFAVQGAFAASAHIKSTAPDFQLSDLQGVVHNLSDYRGKVVVLNFWASWCRDCVLEMPSLNALAERMKNDGLAVIGISIDKNRADLDKIREKVSFPILVDEKGDVFVKKYTVTRLPQTIIIDRSGVIVERLFGGQEFTADSFIEKITNLLTGGIKPL